MGEWGWKSFDTLTGAEVEDLAAGIERRCRGGPPLVVTSTTAEPPDHR
jgi:hypothetical protein